MWGIVCVHVYVCVCVCVCFEFEKKERELEFGSNLSATHPSSGKKKKLYSQPHRCSPAPLYVTYLEIFQS